MMDQTRGGLGLAQGSDQFRRGPMVMMFGGTMGFGAPRAASCGCAVNYQAHQKARGHD